MSGNSTGGGNHCDLVHYRAEFIMLEICILGASGGLASIIWGKGVAFDLHGDQIPDPPGSGVCTCPELHLNREAV